MRKGEKQQGSKPGWGRTVYKVRIRIEGRVRCNILPECVVCSRVAHASTREDGHMAMPYPHVYFPCEIEIHRLGYDA